MKKISTIVMLSLLTALMVGAIPAQAGPPTSTCENFESALLKTRLKSNGWYRLMDQLGTNDCDSDGDGVLNRDDYCPFNADLELRPGADLPNEDLAYEYLYACNLEASTLDFASLFYANLTAADLTGANLHYADLSYADLAGANLAAAGLTGADLSYADLSYADLSYAALMEANLLGADLTGALLGGVHWGNTICPDGTNSYDWYPDETCEYNLELP